MADLSAQTDVSRPSALPTAHIGSRSSLVASRNLSELDSGAYLDLIEEDWNKRVDTEMDVLVESMVDLVGIAAIGNKDKFKIAQESFQAQTRAESMVRAAHSLLSITHSLKLLFLLSDDAQIIQKRDKELKSTREESRQYKQKVVELLNELLSEQSARRIEEREAYPRADENTEMQES
ncbi:hypothetical protein SISSUDRAFT_1061381 [Sistotremastrum suecicum HHB10207 ss-3]|uniref:Mediator of RNA polymerase II transcription subunit 22 n=1 Tax=Sistotremastrum suecicum HHB10207 ss-3 TaxID=1314776 RepID=A0A166E0L8_9AGAM|nr:hypothetical protein SISSUDRAFT_1061381 [Sistotremastrum suecicum HHB10207 ss-3]